MEGRLISRTREDSKRKPMAKTLMTCRIVARALVLLLISAATAHAQTPPPDFQVDVLPPDGSILVEETANVVFVTINNFTLFTNVTVSGSFGPPTNIPFRDNGTIPDQTMDDGTFSGMIITPKVTHPGTNMTLQLVLSGEVLQPPQEPPPDPPPPPIIVTVTNDIDYIIVPRPLNDRFTNAFKILPEGGVILHTNNYASIEPGEPKHAQVPTVDASVWWTWAPAISTNVLIDVAGSSFDPVLAVYTGPNLTSLTPVASSINDTRNGLQANVTFSATAGVTYRIAISGFDTNGVGNILLRAVPGGRPDTNGPLVTIISPAGESLFTTNTVVVDGTAKDVQPHGIGVRQVYLQVNNGPPLLAGGTGDWSGVLTLPPGTNTVRAFAEDWAGNFGPSDVIVLRFVNPTNDFFADAIELPDIGGDVTAINGRATREPGEPFHAGNDGGHSIWYRFRAPANGLLSLSTEGSDFDTLLALYAGDRVTNLTLIAANDDVMEDIEHSELVHAVVSNQVYHIAVDGYGGVFGSINLRYVFTTTERFFRLTVQQPLGGSATPPSGLYLADSTLFITAAPSRDFEFLGWEGSVVSASNPITVTMNQNHSLTPLFRVKSYSEGFESGGFTGLNWSSSGNTPWIVQSNAVSSGRFAARSGPIGDGQRSSLILTVNLLSGTGAFGVRVSSEGGWDSLEFYLNGARLKRWSGEVGWETFLFRVLPGVNTLEWRYSKDANFSELLDAAFIDNLYLPLPDSAIAAQLSLVRLPDGHRQVQVQGLSSRAYIIQASVDLSAWTSVSTNSSDSGIIQWTDPESTSLPLRFYRAIAP